MNSIYKNWFIHNTIAHPIMGILQLTGITSLECIGSKIHDATLPN